jgi:N-acetylmuramic acid 6-phosphate etherase
MLPITEQENPLTRNIDKLPTLDAVRLINDEDKKVAEAVKDVLPDIALAVDGIVDRLKNGGRLFYVGTGTSGRLGVLDASECPPTYGVSPELVQGIIAGGYEALYKAVEASEDNRVAGADDLEKRGVCEKDAVVGIAASGRTPYTIGALEKAAEIGCFTVALTCNPDSEITKVAEVSIVPVVGAEVIAGSTRMKAGTSHKMVLNMLSTCTMIRLGYVTGNRMTNVLPKNIKLVERSLRILEAETGLDATMAKDLMENAGGDLKIAIVMHKTGADKDNAAKALLESENVIENAVEIAQKLNLK